MLWTLKKRMEISASHHLNLTYDSPCQKLHGHNWIVTVEIQGNKLNKDGMLFDFQKIKEIGKQLDHVNLNEHMAGNPTAENIARSIARQIQVVIDSEWDGEKEAFVVPQVSKVTVQETEGNEVCFIP